MNANLERILRRGFGFAVLAFSVSCAAVAACPKVLMFDGVDIRTQNSPQQARYWGQVVGVQGFFLNNIMSDWQQDVGASPTDRMWQQAKQFQETYAKYGVTDNFIKVAIWKPHDWRSPAQNSTVVRDFTDAAALAKYAGFKGIAMDLEPYVPTWEGPAKGSRLSGIVQAEGAAIAHAMHRAYPGMTLVLIKDGLYWAGRKQGYHGGYGLSVPFLRGLLSVPWTRLVVAIESTYNGRGIGIKVEQTQQRYSNFVAKNNLPRQVISVAPGLWPLGKSYRDKTARVSANAFGRHLSAAMASTAGSVWIYGFGSAWQTNGPYGGPSGRPSGLVIANFTDYTHAIQLAKRSCKEGAR